MADLIFSLGEVNHEAEHACVSQFNEPAHYAGHSSGYG
jgi:hypothetical protein